ncbi:MAG: dnaQ [Rickettsiaceae bacterium]|nr:dnaQ [Rickettsiaceae bacterium]
MREIILDTETTGLDPIIGGHKIIEIGAIEMVNKVYTGREFHVYINPKRDIDPEAYKAHGISRDFLRDKPVFKDIAQDFLEFIRGARIVAHNARFDMKFINHELSLIGESTIDMELVIDTLQIARRRFPGARASLDALCDRFKVDNSSRNFHGALLDAKLLAEVYIELCGGRQTKFEIAGFESTTIHMSGSNTSITTISETTIVEEISVKAGHVIEVSEEEAIAHKKFLDKIKNPIWAAE